MLLKLAKWCPFLSVAGMVWRVLTSRSGVKWWRRMMQAGETLVDRSASRKFVANKGIDYILASCIFRISRS